MSKPPSRLRTATAFGLPFAASRLRAWLRARLARIAAVAVLVVAAQAEGQNGSGRASQEEPEYLPSVEQYVVQAGDTLWDISARVVGRPQLWPKVWSFNPEITNPNWIYPGDVVRFHPSEQPLPRMTEAAAVAREMPQEGGGPAPGAEAPAEVESAQAERVEEAAPPAIEVVQAAPIPATRPPRSWQRFVHLFVTPKELAEAGTLTNSAEERVLLGTGDLVYIRFPKGKEVRAGERYMVYRTTGEVEHPVSHDFWGYMTQVTAVATVLRVASDSAMARLDLALVEVERGEYVAPLAQELAAAVPPVPTSHEVAGVVLAVQPEIASVAGDNQLVFVDKGKDDGLERGYELLISTHGDPLTGESDDFPTLDKAKLLVLQTNEHAATCLVTKTRFEIAPGDAFRTAPPPSKK